MGLFIRVINPGKVELLYLLRLMSLVMRLVRLVTRGIRIC